MLLGTLMGGGAADLIGAAALITASGIITIGTGLLSWVLLARPVKQMELSMVSAEAGD